MGRFLTTTDIANRALQILGATRIADGLLDSEDSKNASEMRFAYDKMRRVELRRNMWVFAIKNAVIRPMDTDTMLFNPPTYDATIYYQPGNVVTYASALWVTITPFNIANTPGTSNTWQPYFGPMTMEPYDSDDTYNTGELVYVTSGAVGLVYSFLSLQDSNDDDPSTISAYSAATTYSRGDVVSYSGSDYISLVDLNTANTPASTYALWVAATTYASGNKVITADGRIWTSAGNGNVGHDPLTTTGYWTNASLPYFQAWLTFTGGEHALSWRYLDPNNFVLATDPIPLRGRHHRCLAHGRHVLRRLGRAHGT